MKNMPSNAPEQDDNPYTPERLVWTGRENYIDDLEGTIMALEYLKEQLIDELRTILKGVSGLMGEPAEPIVNKDNVRLARYGSCIDKEGLHPVYEIKTDDLITYWRISAFRNMQGAITIRRGLRIKNVTPTFRDTLDN